MKQEYLAGFPLGRLVEDVRLQPKAVDRAEPDGPATVALARNPDPHTLPRELNPSVVRSGPKSTENGAVPVVDCQIDLDTMPSLPNASTRRARRGSTQAGSRPAPR